MAHGADEPVDTRRLVDHDEVDTLFATVNPNPDRIGCPSNDVLVALARRERGLDDPGYRHLTQCSECYRAFRSLQEQARGKASSDRSILSWVSIAASVVLVAAGAWFYARSQVSAPAVSAPPIVARRIELDLRPYATSRSEQGSTAHPPLSFMRDNFEVTLLLPTGSDPGAYDVQLLDPSSRVLASASGSADISNFVTTLKVSIDLRAISAGDYRLMARRQGDDWHAYPAVVR